MDIGQTGSQLSRWILKTKLSSSPIFSEGKEKSLISKYRTYSKLSSKAGMIKKNISVHFATETFNSGLAGWSTAVNHDDSIYPWGDLIIYLLLWFPSHN